MSCFAALLCPLLAVAAFCQADDPARTLAAGNAPEALEQVDGLLKADPGNPRLLTVQGLALIELHREREALASFERALTVSPKSLPALRGAAEAAYTARDPKAVEYAKLLLSLAPDDPTANAIAGVLAFETKDCSATVAHFVRSEPLLSRNAAALAQYGECLARLERYPEAAAQFGRALKIQPAAARPARRD